MAGIRSDNMYKNIIDYISESYNITINNKEKFKINYSQNREDEIKIFLEWRKYGDVLTSERISYNFKYSVLSADNEYYILLENYNYEFEIDFLEEIEFNLGHLIFLFKDRKHYPSLNPLKNKDEVIEVLDIIDDEYEYHEFDDIKELLLDIRIFKIEKDCPFEFDDINIQDSINRILSLIFVCQYENKQFYYLTEESLQEYRKIIMLDIKYFSYENILLSLLEDKPSKVFLEIYRIIERLYPYIMIKKFKDQIQHKLNDTDEENIFIIHNALGSINWNYNEETCLKNLFKEIDFEIEDDLKDLIIRSSGGNMEFYRWIYRIRNSIVHLSIKGTDKDIDIKVALEKDTVILKILKVLPILYDKCFG